LENEATDLIENKGSDFEGIGNEASVDGQKAEGTVQKAVSRRGSAR